MSSHSIPSSDVKPARSVYQMASYTLPRDLGVGEYSRRSWTRRLSAVLLASLLLVGALFAMGIPLDSLTLLLLIPLLALSFSPPGSWSSSNPWWTACRTSP